MRFGPVPVTESAGATAVHALQLPGLVLRKGEIVTAATASALALAGVREIVVARLEPGDVGENEAARELAEAACGPGLRVDRAFTGRANLFATASGLLVLDRAAVDAVNAVDESITLATLPPFRAVAAGEMVATIKIIPFAVARPMLDAARRRAAEAPLRVAPFRAQRVGVVSTLLPGLKETVVAKTLRALGTRLAAAGSAIAVEAAVAHEIAPLSAALGRQAAACDLVVVFGASAIADRRDVVPAAVLAAGGTIEHFGMPVDPGNLLLLGRVGTVPVIGAPGCARSPKENGFDWVLQRLLADLPVAAADLRALGTGGLLMEIVSRPQLRQGDGAGEDA